MRLGSKQFLNASKKSKRRAGFLIFLMIVLFLLALGGYYVLCILRPSVISMAKSRANEIATLEVNKVISRKLKSEDIDFSDIISFTYTQDGDIAALGSNVSYVSALKSDLAIEVTEALNGISESQLSIPLGTLSGMDIFYGTGPRVPLKIMPYGYAVADIETRFYDSGINQTAFEVVAHVHANVSVLMPTIRQGMKITASVPVASAVVVGDVPDSYTNVERHGEEFEDDVLELIE